MTKATTATTAYDSWETTANKLLQKVEDLLQMEENAVMIKEDAFMSVMAIKENNCAGCAASIEART